MKKLSFILMILFSVSAGALNVSDVERLAIQDGGRIKPFDTFARESTQLITGTQIHQGKNATELVLSWLFLPDQWLVEKFIQVKHLQLKKEIGVAENQSYISPDEIVHNPKLPQLFTQLAQLQKEKKKLNPYFQALSRMNNQLVLYQEIIAGRAIKVLPQTLSSDWIAVADLKGEPRELFANLAKSYFPAIGNGDERAFHEAVKKFKDFAMAQTNSNYPSESQIDQEIIYNSLHPFRLAYIFYFVAGLLFLLSLKFIKSMPWFYSSLGFAVTGFLIHAVGFGFRCVIAGRPPVSNMYESVIWVSAGCVFFGLVFEFIYRRRYIGLAAMMMATIGLIIGDSVPAVLDQSIKPLEPVLRSNYWLTIHVLTITLSYAAFALSCGIGNIALSYYARGKERENSEKLQALALFVYRAVQVGVLLLTAGTILGGVWADYSWGRFWGWDPKETWALIADLGYLAVLHGRFSGLLKTFGTIAASVGAFAGVIMAWYGVNFVLGVGLHSYGFGGGGVFYVTGVVVAQLLYIAWAAYQHHSVSANLKVS